MAAGGPGETPARGGGAQWWRLGETHTTLSSGPEEGSGVRAGASATPRSPEPRPQLPRDEGIWPGWSQGPVPSPASQSLRKIRVSGPGAPIWAPLPSVNAPPPQVTEQASALMRPPQGRTVNGASMCPVGLLAIVGAVSPDTQSHCVGPAPARPTLWLVGGSQERPSSWGALWTGRVVRETDVCRAASGAAIKGSGQRWRQASAMVVAGWLAVGPFISQGGWGVRRPPWPWTCYSG